MLRAKAAEYAWALSQESEYEVVNRVTEAAEAHGVNNAQVAGLTQYGVAAPSVGARKLEHLKD
jgi:aryl-alcohol dehydrogenase-like predicted oxidoreductase